MSEARALTTAAPNVTITVQITVTGEALPMAARRLVNDLRELASGGSGAAVPDVTALPQARALPEVGGPAEPRIGQESRLPAPAREPALRLVGPPKPTPEPPPGCSVLRVDTGPRQVSRDGVPVHLARREYDLLVFLCEYPRRVFSRGQLLRQVWGYEMVGGERTVDVHIRRLRAKLGDCAGAIVTVRGVGYRFDDESAIRLVMTKE